MNRLLRALWDRLLPPGGDVAVARGADDDGPWVDVHVLEPLRLGDEEPGPDDLDPSDRCWWWVKDGGWVRARPRLMFTSPGDLWLPHWAIADPSVEP
jgi:hypothetical protein